MRRRFFSNFVTFSEYLNFIFSNDTFHDLNIKFYWRYYSLILNFKRIAQTLFSFLLVSKSFSYYQVNYPKLALLFPWRRLLPGTWTNLSQKWLRSMIWTQRIWRPRSWRCNDWCQPLLAGKNRKIRKIWKKK